MESARQVRRPYSGLWYICPATAERETSRRSVEDQLSSLLDAWPLGPILSVARATGGATNRVYRVDTASRAVFLRIYQKADRATALREHGVIR